MYVVDYQPPGPVVVAFLKSNARVKFLLGPLGSGKSSACCIDIFKRICEMPPCKDGIRRSRWAIVRNTASQLKTTTWRTWIQWFPIGVVGEWRESEKLYIIRSNDVYAELFFLPLDSPQDTQRLLSLELTGVFVNEAREIPPEVFPAALARTRRYPPKSLLSPNTEYWSGLILDSNPPTVDSWLYKTFEEDRPEGWEIFKQPSGLSPEAENLENLVPGYYEDLVKGATEEWVNVHVHGKYGHSLLGKPVFEKSFTYSFHVSKDLLSSVQSSNYPIIIGLDFGRTPAAVLGQRDWRGRVLVLDALYVENIGLELFLEQYLKPLLRNKFSYNKYIVVGDPAGWAKSQLSEENAHDVLRRAGFKAMRAPTNDVEKRIRAVEKLLLQQIDGKAMLLFNKEDTSEGMRKLIRAMEGGYKYREKRDGSYEAKPLKDEYSHLADALQYFCLGVDLEEGGYLRAVERKEVKLVSAVGWT